MAASKALQLLHAGCVIPAVPLALDRNRKWDERRQRAVLRYYLNAGADGLAVAVHTTQFEIRDKGVELFEPLLRLASEEMDAYAQRTGHTVVRVAGVCGPAEQAVAEAEAAVRLGFDAVLLSPGGLGAYDEDYLIARTVAVAAVAPVIGFYLQRAVGGRRFSFDYWTRVAETPNVVAVKAAPFDRYLTAEMVRAVALSNRADEITLYTGNDDNIVADLLTTYRFEKNGNVVEKSFEGGLLGHWAVWTNRAVEIFHALRAAKRSGNITPELLTLAAQITDANAAFFDTAHDFAGCIAGIHEVLRRQGIFENILCLNPEEGLSAGQSEEIDRVYAQYPHLHDDAFVAAHLREWLD